MVKWNNSLSSSINIVSGVRQGGVLSGHLFNMYVDVILSTLRRKDLGCHLLNLFLGAIMYADDLLLLSSSIYDLQTMLDTCDDIGKNLGLIFNPTKSCCISIGPGINDNFNPQTVSIGKLRLPLVDKLEYLGILILRAKSFQVDLSKIKRKFFASANNILSKCSFTSEPVQLHLLESHCLPILLYASESLNYPECQLKELSTCWNSIYRKIFCYNKWESVKSLILFSGRLDLNHLINLRSLRFLLRMKLNPMTPTSLASYLFSNYFSCCESVGLFKKYCCYGIEKNYLLKKSIYDHFRTLTLSRDASLS